MRNLSIYFLAFIEEYLKKLFLEILQSILQISMISFRDSSKIFFLSRRIFFKNFFSIFFRISNDVPLGLFSETFSGFLLLIPSKVSHKILLGIPLKLSHETPPDIPQKFLQELLHQLLQKMLQSILFRNFFWKFLQVQGLPYSNMVYVIS